MTPFLHFTPGDVLWFPGWQPLTARAMLGTCIGLFLFGLVERWIATSRAIIELHWDKRYSFYLLHRRLTAHPELDQRRSHIVKCE
jgi:hypothetical protein